MKYFYKFSSIILLLIIISCAKPELTNEEINDNTQKLLEIPDGFDFSTYRTIKVKINDNSYAKYDVYAYTSQPYLVEVETYENQEGILETQEVYRNDVMNKLLFSGVTKNGTLEHTINLPTFYDKVYIRRNDNLKYSASVEGVVNNEVDFTHTESSGRFSGVEALLGLADNFPIGRIFDGHFKRRG